MHDLINTRSLADNPDQCARVFAFLFQSELDRFDRIGEFYPIVFALICLDQGGQNVQLVAFCRTLGGIPQLLHSAQCPLVIGFPSNGFDVSRRNKSAGSELSSTAVLISPLRKLSRLL